jgi:hypothetical protein
LAPSFGRCALISFDVHRSDMRLPLYAFTSSSPLC